MIRYRDFQSHRSCKCWDDLKRKLLALRGGNVPRLADPAQRDQGGISEQQTGRDWCLQPYTRYPSRRRRASQQCDSGRWFGRLRTAILPWAEMLGGLTEQVNERDHESHLFHHASQERAANISMFTNQQKLLCWGLTTDHFLQIFRVASPLHGDLRDGALNFAKIVGRELDRNCSKVFFEARRLGRARDRNNPRFLDQQPSQCDLRRCRLLFFCELAKQIHDGLICFASLGGKARNDITEISAIKLRILVDLAGQETLAKWAKWNEADAQFLKSRYDFLFRFSEPQRIFALECRYRLNRVRATDGLHSCFRQPEVLHFTLADQVLHSSRDIFNGHVRVNAVLVEEIDGVSREALERSFSDFLDVHWPAIQPGLLAGVRINFEPELGGDHHLFTQRSERFAHQFFVGVRTIYFCSIEEGDAAFDGRPNQRNSVLLVHGGPEAEAHSHAAKSEGRDLQITLSKFAFLH